MSSSDILKRELVVEALNAQQLVFENIIEGSVFRMRSEGSVLIR